MRIEKQYVSARPWVFLALSQALYALLLQRLEQYLTLSQSRSHFFLQVKGRWQIGQIFVGRSALATDFPFLRGMGGQIFLKA